MWWQEGLQWRSSFQVGFVPLWRTSTSCQEVWWRTARQAEGTQGFEVLRNASSYLLPSSSSDLLPSSSSYLLPSSSTDLLPEAEVLPEAQVLLEAQVLCSQA